MLPHPHPPFYAYLPSQQAVLEEQQPSLLASQLLLVLLGPLQAPPLQRWQAPPEGVKGDDDRPDAKQGQVAEPAVAAAIRLGEAKGKVRPINLHP